MHPAGGSRGPARRVARRAARGRAHRRLRGTRAHRGAVRARDWPPVARGRCRRPARPGPCPSHHSAWFSPWPGISRLRAIVTTVAQVLVVDDSKVMRDMIVACLRPEPGLGFAHAASGLEAIERLSLAAFDLVVLDLN